MSHTDNLKQVGLKTTLPRLKVLELLEKNNIQHVSAEDVYRLMLENNESVGLATIYRVLTQFESAGLVLRHNFGDRAVFELTNTDHHDHMVCVECNTITEFHDCTIEKQQQQIADKHDFQIEDHALILYGRCANCTKK